MWMNGTKKENIAPSPLSDRAERVKTDYEFSLPYHTPLIQASYGCPLMYMYTICKYRQFFSIKGKKMKKTNNYLLIN